MRNRLSGCILLLLVVFLNGCGRGPVTRSLQSPFYSEVDQERSHLQVAASALLDPRAGVALNSGQRLSAGEQLRMVIPGLGFLLVPGQLVAAGMGVTETEFRYNSGLDSLAGEHSLELARFLSDRGLLSEEQYQEYLRHAFLRYEYPHPSLLRLFGGAPPPSGRSFWEYARHWPATGGPDRFSVQYMEEFGLLSAGEVDRMIHNHIFHNPSPRLPQPELLLMAETRGLLSTDQANDILFRRFWSIYEKAILARELNDTHTFDPKYNLPHGSFLLEKSLIEIYLQGQTITHGKSEVHHH